MLPGLRFLQGNPCRNSCEFVPQTALDLNGIPNSCQKRPLFLHDLLAPPASGWGSGACLPSSLFFLSSGKGFCSIMICMFFHVLPGSGWNSGACLPSSFFFGSGACLPSSLLSFLRKRVLFHHDLLVLPCSSWFRLGFRCLSPFFSLLWFRCLSPFFSLLSFLRKGVLFHHDLLVLPCSSWFRLEFWCLSPFFSRFWFRCLSPFFSLLSFLRKRVLFHHDLLDLPCSSWFRLGFRCLSPFFSLPWFRCLSPFFSLLIMICWFFLVPAGVPVLVSLLLSSLVSVLVSLLLLSSFCAQERVLFHHALLVVLASGWGSAACLSYSLLFFGSGACFPSSLFFFPSGKGFCSIMIIMICSWFRLGFRCLCPLFSLLCFRCLSPFFSLLWFRCLSPFFSLLSFLRKGVLFHHDLLVLPCSSWFRLGSGACLPFPFFLFLGQGFCSIMDSPVPPASGWGSGACLPSSRFFGTVRLK